MEDANQDTGAEPLNVDTAAQKILGMLDTKPEDDKEVHTETEDTEETKDTEDTEDTGSSDSSETSSKEAKQDSQEHTFQNLQQLAEAINVPMDDFMGTIKARVKIAGEERDVTLKELRDGYQMESDYRKKTSELAEHRRNFEAERERAANEINNRFNEAQQISGILENQLMTEYKSINWNELRATNPAEFAALKQEYNDRYSQIQTVKANVANHLQAQQNEMNLRQSKELQSMLLSETEKLQAAIPEFREDAKAKELKTKLKDYLKTYGYNDQEIANVYDHRHVMILKDAMAYRAMQSKKPELNKKIANLPKIQKPGTTKSKADTSNERISHKMSKLRKSGNTKDLASVLLEKL